MIKKAGVMDWQARQRVLLELDAAFAADNGQPRVQMDSNSDRSMSWKADDESAYKELPSGAAPRVSLLWTYYASTPFNGARLDLKQYDLELLYQDPCHRSRYWGGSHQSMSLIVVLSDFPGRVRREYGQWAISAGYARCRRGGATPGQDGDA